MSFGVEYKTIVCIFVLADVDVNACLKKAVKTLFMKRIVTYSETDIGSDASDDMKDGLIHHLSRCLLNSTCDSSLLDK